MAKLDHEKPRHDTVMDVTEERIASVYAQAFMGVAAKSANPTSLVAEVASVVEDVLDRSAQLDETLRSELVTSEEKVRLLDRIFSGRAATEVVNFLKVLASHKRLPVLRSIAQVLKKLDAERRGLTDVELRVATPLDDALRGEIENGLRKTLGREAVLHVVEDPTLIAGLVIRVGDRVYDGSVHTQLESARRAMIERAIDTIESHTDRFVASAG